MTRLGVDGGGEENVQQGSRNRVDLTGGETGASADGGKGGKWRMELLYLVPGPRFIEYVHYPGNLSYYLYLYSSRCHLIIYIPLTLVYDLCTDSVEFHIWTPRTVP